MVLDTHLMARIQFAFTISFHILFPAFSIGLVTLIAILEGVYLKTQSPAFRQMAKFWTKIFALTFGMGIVSGIVMEFQLGTNWSGLTARAGPVLGALFTYEVMTAFFIEAGFLGVMLFGWNKVKPGIHFTATLLVALGTTISAYWIMAANTWMQHPVGYHLIGHTITATHWSSIIFNKAIFPRYCHMLLASYLATAFVVIGLSGHYLLRGQHGWFAKPTFKAAWWAIVLLVPLQGLIGDWTGEEVHANQPIKTAAIEGLWHTTRGAPFVIFAIPDSHTAHNRWAVTVPHMASVINTHHWNGTLEGITSVPRADRPDVPVVFFSFRIMLLIGLAMGGLAVMAAMLLLTKKWTTARWFFNLCRFTSPIGFIALWAGWITAEVGRQPWAIYHVLRTRDASTVIPVQDVWISFLLMVIVYGIVFGMIYCRFLKKLIRHGPTLANSSHASFPRRIT